jgi:hypothetical protein
MTRYIIPVSVTAIVGALTIDWHPCDQPCPPVERVTVTGNDTGCIPPFDFMNPGSKEQEPWTDDSLTCSGEMCSLVAVVRDGGGGDGGESSGGDDASKCKDWERPCDKGDDPFDPFDRPGCCPTAARDNSTNGVTLACWNEDRAWRGEFGQDDTCYDSTGAPRENWETGPCYDRRGHVIRWWKNYPGDQPD